MGFELAMIVIMEPFDRRLLDCNAIDLWLYSQLWRDLMNQFSDRLNKDAISVNIIILLSMIINSCEEQNSIQKQT